MLERGLGRNPRENFTLMLFYVFLHHLLSIFVNVNNFLSFFLMFSSLFFSFGSLQLCQGGAAAPSAPPQGGAVTCQGGAAAPSAPPWLRP